MALFIGNYWVEIEVQFAQDEVYLSHPIRARSASFPGSAYDLRSWKTYRNEKYGFEIKYPPGVDFKECGNPTVGFDYDSNRICNTDGRFIIHVVPSSLLPLDDVIRLVNSQLNDSINTTSIISGKKWDTFRGIIKEKRFGDFKAVHNFILLGENLYEISFVIESNKDPGYYTSVFNMMISTFKFTPTPK